MTNPAWQILAILAFLLSFGILRIVLYWEPWKYRSPKMTGFATLLSRHVVYNHGWRYYATFSLGSLQMELETTETAYTQMHNGSRGQLIWQGSRMCEFTTEEECL